jgi:hypothetical protein
MLGYRGIVNTGSIVRLHSKFVAKNDHKWPSKEFWHGEFRVNVIPMPCEGEEIKEYKVEFLSLLDKDKKRGFACRLTPDNRLVDNDPEWKDCPVIGDHT